MWIYNFYLPIRHGNTNKYQVEIFDFIYLDEKHGVGPFCSFVYMKKKMMPVAHLLGRSESAKPLVIYEICIIISSFCHPRSQHETKQREAHIRQSLPY